MRFPGPVRDRPPADVVSRAALSPGERVLAWAESERWLLGTRAALYLVGQDEVERIAWESVESARWDRESGLFHLTSRADWGDVKPSLAAHVDDADRLLQLVRERVTASIVMQRRVPVFGTHGFTIHARRPPTGGAVAWFVEYDAGVRPDDPDVAARVAAGLADAQAELI